VSIRSAYFDRQSRIEVEKRRVQLSNVALANASAKIVCKDVLFKIIYLIETDEAKAEIIAEKERLELAKASRPEFGKKRKVWTLIVPVPLMPVTVVLPQPVLVIRNVKMELSTVPLKLRAGCLIFQVKIAKVGVLEVGVKATSQGFNPLY
jgi:hypothetical protein